MRTVYLDYNATTPLDAGVKEVMLPYFGDFFGNPSSVHQVGRRSRAKLDEFRERVALVWGCKASEVVFTSGATESISLAICGTARFLKNKGRHLITSAIEHHAVLHAFEYLVNKEGFELSILPVDVDGRVNSQDLLNIIRDDTIFVSVMAVNNETGAIQPVAELGDICRNAGVVFHTDAVQWFGKEPFVDIHQFNADLVSICSHKFYGPKGSGALFIKSPLLPDPILFGGSHENERRAGTENLAAIAGLVDAIERFLLSPVFSPSSILPFSKQLSSLGDIPEVSLVSSLSSCLANSCSFTIAGVDNLTFLAALDLEGICASGGSACSSGSLLPSHVLSAMGKSPEEAKSLIRFSLGRETLQTDIDLVLDFFPFALRRILDC